MSLLSRTNDSAVLWEHSEDFDDFNAAGKKSHVVSPSTSKQVKQSATVILCFSEGVMRIRTVVFDRLVPPFWVKKQAIFKKRPFCFQRVGLDSRAVWSVVQAILPYVLLKAASAYLLHVFST